MSAPPPRRYESIPSSEGDSSDAEASLPRWKHFLRVGVATLMLMAVAMYGRKAGWIMGEEEVDPQVVGGGGEEVGGGDGEGGEGEEERHGNIAARPCVVYHWDNTNGESESASASPKNFHMIQTSLSEPSRPWGEMSCDHHHLPHTPAHDLPDDYAFPSATIDVDFASTPFAPSRHGAVLGFGGAFTEAAALNYNSLGEEGREAVMELLFGRSGLGYSLGRTHMNSCDFCVESYSFDETEDDFSLKDFDHNVTHDVEVGMIGMMKRADEVLRESWGSKEEGSNTNKKRDTADLVGMRIIASPWSPPSWMKAPTTWEEVKEGAVHAENMLGSALPVCLRDGAGKDSKYAESWALFFSKFISAYANHGINLYGITVQNEPEFPAPWDACAYDAIREGEFIAYHLGPTLASAHPDIKLLMFDHNKDHVVEWARLLLDPDHPAAKYIDGTAYHWYAGGMDRLLDGAQGMPNMHRLVEDLNEKGLSGDEEKDDHHIILGSEACHCPSTGYAGGDLDIAWARATRNAHTLLADLAAGSHGFIEWNLILDSIGGPNHLGNMCDAPLLAVPHRALQKGNATTPSTLDFEHADHPFGRTHGDERTREELNAVGTPAKYLDVGVAVQPMYYYVGHVTRYVRPGSWAVMALVDGGGSGSDSSGDDRHRAFGAGGVAGGGMNDLARNGIELTVWPCEGSTRQEFRWNNEIKRLQVFGHDWLGVPTASCAGREARKDLGGLMLTDCNDGSAGSFHVVPSSDGFVNVVLTSDGDGEDEATCMVIAPLKNNGGAYGPRGGAQVVIGDCDDPFAEWRFDTTTGELSSNAYEDEGGEVCLTTGWPFLQAGAFDTSAATGSDEASKAIVVLNEAGEGANYVLRSGGRIVMSANIPPHSIQTISYD